MPIYYDPTEARVDSRLAEGVINAGKPLVGLEALTGADLLLTASECPFESVSQKMPHPLLNTFLKLTSHGMLVARKSGTDLVRSLVNLDSILMRMLDWTGPNGEAWLVSTGVHDEDMKGNIVVDGRSTGVRYTRVMARVTLWQRRGGYYVNLPNDRRLVSWCARWEQSWSTKPELKVVRERHVILVDAPWWERLTLVPNVGNVRAVAIGKWLPEGYRTFGDALAYLSWPENYNPKDHPEGVGPALFETTRKWLGSRDGEAFSTYKVPPDGLREGGPQWR